MKLARPYEIKQKPVLLFVLINRQYKTIQTLELLKRGVLGYHSTPCYCRVFPGFNSTKSMRRSPEDWRPQPCQWQTDFSAQNLPSPLCYSTPFQSSQGVLLQKHLAPSNSIDPLAWIFAFPSSLPTSYRQELCSLPSPQIMSACNLSSLMRKKNLRLLVQFLSQWFMVAASPQRTLMSFLWSSMWLMISRPLVQSIPAAGSSLLHSGHRMVYDLRLYLMERMQQQQNSWLQASRAGVRMTSEQIAQRMLSQNYACIVMINVIMQELVISILNTIEPSFMPLD